LYIYKKVPNHELGLSYPMCYTVGFIYYYSVAHDSRGKGLGTQPFTSTLSRSHLAISLSKTSP